MWYKFTIKVCKRECGTILLYYNGWYIIVYKKNVVQVYYNGL